MDFQVGQKPKLLIRPLTAKLTRDTEGMFGKMDPYCKISIGGKWYKSKVHTDGGKNPVWQDSYLHPLTGETEATIQVWDEDSVGKDDMVGDCVVSLQDTIVKRSTTDWYELKYKGKSSGKVCVNFEFV